MVLVCFDKSDWFVVAMDSDGRLSTPRTQPMSFLDLVGPTTNALYVERRRQSWDELVKTGEIIVHPDVTTRLGYDGLYELYGPDGSPLFPEEKDPSFAIFSTSRVKLLNDMPQAVWEEVEGLLRNLPDADVVNKISTTTVPAAAGREAIRSMLAAMNSPETIPMQDLAINYKQTLNTLVDFGTPTTAAQDAGSQMTGKVDWKIIGEILSMLGHAEMLQHEDAPKEKLKLLISTQVRFLESAFDG